MAQIPFTVSARTARLIGRENVSNAEGALVELVKNSYDADALTCIILIDLPNDEILLIDNGDGMTDKIIQEQWMIIGTDEKLYNPVTTTGRVKAGAKGIGRFALDRLGEKCTMITFPVHNSIGFEWLVDWSSFEERSRGRNKNIDEVYAELNELIKTTYKNQLLKKVSNDQAFKLISGGAFKNGTFLKINGLRDNWTNSTINNVFENLELLTPPEGAHRMNIYLFNASEPEKYGLVENSEFTNYDYKVVATYEKNKDFLVTIDVHRNEFDQKLISPELFDFPDMKVYPFDKKTFKKEHFILKKPFSELIRGFQDNKGYAENIGDFVFTFYFLKNNLSRDDRERLKYKEIESNRSPWLKKFGGVKLYRDNFRIRPYGEAGTQAYDWLMLGERSRINPAAVTRKGSWRIGANQIVGIVSFSRLTNPFLEDKSSREGLQENEVFNLFKNLLLGIIKVQEDDRSTIAYNLNEQYKIENKEEEAIEESIEIANESETDFENDTPEENIRKNKQLRAGIKAQNRKLKEKNEEISLSRAMASIGVMVASFSHEFHRMKNELSSRSDELKSYIKSVVDIKKLNRVPDRQNPLLLLDELKAQDTKIKQWIEFTMGLTQRDRRKNKSINLPNYFEYQNELWKRLFTEREINYKIHYNKAQKDSLNIKISELDLDTIFDNLITNSLEAFERNNFNESKSINIFFSTVQSTLRLKYKDSGPGIDKSFSNINDIFNPFETSKKDDEGNDIGTGLGMWLVKSTIDFNKGQVELIRPAKGFEINLSFKIK